MTSPLCGSRSRASAGLPRLRQPSDQRLERRAAHADPEMRTTAIAAGGRPEERAKMVSRAGGIV